MYNYNIGLDFGSVHLGMCAGRIGRVNANIFIQSTTSGLGKFQSATNPSKFKFGGLVTNIGGFNSGVRRVGINNI